MTADWSNSSFDDSRWVQFAQASMSPGASVEQKYPPLKEIRGTYEDAIQLVPILQIRRFVDSVEVIAGAKVTQFDAQRRVEGQCRLSYADMDMLLGMLATAEDCDVIAPDRFTISTKYGFTCRWSVDWNSTKDLSVGVNSMRLVTVARRHLTERFGECQEFADNNFG